MSDLLKNIQKKKGLPPKPTKEKKEEVEDSGDEEEEEKDTILADPNQKPFEYKIPVKPTQSFASPDDIKPPKKKGLFDFTPDKWENYFDKMIYMEDGTSIFLAGTQGPLYVCLHGAGHSALTFSLLAEQVKGWGQLACFDFIGHGYSKKSWEGALNLSEENLIAETLSVLDYLDSIFPEPSFILLGHSMGGAIACKATEHALGKAYGKRIQGLVVIDVVEGTAMEALPFMESIIMSRPKSFKTVDSAIQWAVKSKQTHNSKSARVSIPAQLIEKKDESGNIVAYDWKVDLLQSQVYWRGWFKGLTQSFLSVRIPKLLMIAEKERMDKELTIAQMQGKFKLVVLQGVGHAMQEDDPVNTALNLHMMIEKFKIPISLEELDILTKNGIGGFHPNLKAFK